MSVLYHPRRWGKQRRLMMDNEQRYQLVGGVPRMRMKFLVSREGDLEGVVWERSAEVRTIPADDYLERRRT